MKKSIALMLSLVVIVGTFFAACTSNKNDDKETTKGLADTNSDYGFELDEDGNEVNVVYEKDKKGDTVAYVVDNNGEKVTNKNGESVTVKTDVDLDTYTTTTTTTTTSDNSDSTTTTTRPVTATTKKDTGTTQNDLTTIDKDKDKVPSTSDTGKEVTFSKKDQEIIASMLEVPGLTSVSYENASGVPTELAVHAAVWMAQREGTTSTTYPSGTIVLDLFKYFGQTVINFKSNCNEYAKSENSPISYVADTDVFTVTKSESKEQTVKITKIEELGNNNYYKVTATVSGTKFSSVSAIIQKNKLDSTLGFSIKALKWTK